jgi:hypothetical protein
MEMQNYELRYLPLFYRDLLDALDYIQNTLCNSKAATGLLEKTEKAIVARLYNPTSPKPYGSKKNRRDAYYCIYVDNYIVFYVVIDNIMEVRRFIYAKRDIEKLL